MLALSNETNLSSCIKRASFLPKIGLRTLITLTHGGQHILKFVKFCYLKNPLDYFVYLFKIVHKFEKRFKVRSFIILIIT